MSTQEPTTKVNFTTTLSDQEVDKVDLLFMIDNSESMGDKQAILADAVPTLLLGLLTPKCLDPTGKQAGTATADPNGNRSNNYNCPKGSAPEFRPVTDMHIGIISSSLGGMGGDLCKPSDSPRNDDKGHLLNVGTASGPSGQGPAGASRFLAWFPSNEENGDAARHPAPADPVKTLGDLETRFQALVRGVDQTGCGFEAQLESVYRFLVQPDPWVQVTRDEATGQASLGAPEAIDYELLKQRADFLRGDSLVAIIELTDEDDSSADPLSLNGFGWGFASREFPFSNTARADRRDGTTAPRATSACRANPGSPECTTCRAAASCGPPPGSTEPVSAACQKLRDDPECKKNGGDYGPTEDALNVRFHRMKERFGVDPQYPIQRYVDGFTKPTVPDRSAEHPETAAPDGGSLDRTISAYRVENAGKCTNPLFAANLPKKPGDPTCLLPRSKRGPDRIFFAVVGGVPNTLLHFDPGDPEKSRVTNDDWNKILGRNPLAFDYDGIDMHMVQSVAPRPGLPAPRSVVGQNGDPNDPAGREWDTRGTDLQYACTFDLPSPRECTGPSCDCAEPKAPPLCNAQRQQIKAKAYPTIRELMVARALGERGIVASLCPLTLQGDKHDPRYGYNPAVASILERLKAGLTQCLPRRLTRDGDSGEVPCLVLAQLGEPTDTCERAGLSRPPPEIERKFLEEQRRASGNIGDGGIDLAARPVCVLPQVVVKQGESCKESGDKAWCYAENDPGAPASSPAGKCPQAILFTAGTGGLNGATYTLQCIQQSGSSE